jgi:toxin ParE1/3/4
LRTAVVRPSAQREIRRIAEYLQDESGEDIAERFVDATEDSFKTLAATPKAGVRCGFSKPVSRALRRWPVKGFENWLIFYRAKRDGVEIVRLVHGARDVAAHLDG